jgi:HSP20 family protein
MLDFHERINRVLEWGSKEGVVRKQASWNPPVDILETPDDYIFRLELPGVGKDNINIEVEGTLLTVSGHRSMESEPQIAAYHSIERVHGIFRRDFRMPGNVDLDRIEARYIDGVLDLRLPKAAKSRQGAVTVVCMG